MIDVHNHILPGLDDGSGNLEITLEMAKMAAADGITAIAATSHYHSLERCRTYSLREYEKVFYKVRELLHREGIPMYLYPGMEVMASLDLEDQLLMGEIQTLNAGKYLLVEFPFQEDPQIVNYILGRLQSHGAVPVIAHPERYFFVQENPVLAYEWAKKGIPIQVNKSSFLGSFGKKAQKLAYKFLECQWITVIASDAHGIMERKPVLSEVYRELETLGQTEYLRALFYENPARICGNKNMIRREPRPYFQ